MGKVAQTKGKLKEVKKEEVEAPKEAIGVPGIDSKKKCLEEIELLQLNFINAQIG